MTTTLNSDSPFYQINLLQTTEKANRIISYRCLISRRHTKTNTDLEMMLDFGLRNLDLSYGVEESEKTSNTSVESLPGIQAERKKSVDI